MASIAVSSPVKEDTANSHHHASQCRDEDCLDSDEDGFVLLPSERERFAPAKVTADADYTDVLKVRFQRYTDCVSPWPVGSEGGNNESLLSGSYYIIRGLERDESESRCSGSHLEQLANVGILYNKNNLLYKVRFKCPVEARGDCMFLSLALAMSANLEELDARAEASKIRGLAVEHFLKGYWASTPDEQTQIDTTIRNMYAPDLSVGWGVQNVQTHWFVVEEKCAAQVYGRTDAEAYHRLLQVGECVDNARAYAKYMNVGRFPSGHIIVPVTFNCNGLLSVDVVDDRMAWGDDIVLNVLASAYGREIFVVLTGADQVFFLGHSPTRESTEINDPIFILMRAGGTIRGGDHYEPMTAEIGTNKVSSLGSIG